ncbi:MAG: hypothetical protein CM15mV26_0110 [uncultured marine virus]|nr:MAG: hypothetical protein CM15mV26_0110 [uncultured marine virus]
MSDYIASVELGQKQLDHSEFDTFKDFYTHAVAEVRRIQHH